MVIYGTDIIMTRGDSESITVNIKNSDGSAYEFVTGDILYLSVKSAATDSKNQFQIKTIALGGEIELVLGIEPEHTKFMSFKTYIYDVQLTRANGKVTTLIPVSNFTIREEVTND